MPAITLTAPAKLNLFLHITGKRPDGYHLLESLVAFTAFGDQLEITPAADTLSLSITGPFAPALGNGADNLVLRAARLLKTLSGVTQGAKIILHKNIPIGAGLGGGSSDAAATLKGLARLWQLPDGNPHTMQAALQLGSDVPACLLARTVFMSGVGETLSPIPMQADTWVLLANPRQPLLTADVFGKFSGAFTRSSPAPAALTSLEALLAAAAPCHNDLEAPAISQLPVIANIIAALSSAEGCRLARMSGSGATCFGLFPNQMAATNAQNILAQAHPDWWYAVTYLQNG